jgi:hypothetical protein
VLVDAGHTKWIFATSAAALLALGAYFWLAGQTPGGVTGGSTAGLWFGLLGASLMVFAGLLSALRKLPALWLLSRGAWLKGHIYLGLLSVVLILCHSGFRWGGPLEAGLWVAFGLVTATGVLGLVLQQVLPRLLTASVACEAPYEQIPHLCRQMRRRADALMEEIWQTDVQVSQTNLAADSQYGLGAKFQFFQFYEKHVRPYLDRGARGSPRLANALQAESAFSGLRALPGLRDFRDHLARLEAYCDERRQLEAQERMQFWLHAWLLAHVPLSLVLLVLGVLHAWTALYY